MILAIGQETDDKGWVLGLQISLFDLRDNSNPSVIRHLIEVDAETYSYSAALWDNNAVRYNRETGLLIIPVDLNGRDAAFSGFKLFVVTDTEIVEDEDCSVDFSPEAFNSDADLWYCASLPPVSFGTVPTRRQ